MLKFKQLVGSVRKGQIFKNQAGETIVVIMARRPARLVPKVRRSYSFNLDEGPPSAKQTLAKEAK